MKLDGSNVYFGTETEGSEAQDSVNTTLGLSSSNQSPSDTTASGSMTVGSDTVSGKFSSACVNSSLDGFFGSSGKPGFINSIQFAYVITGNNSGNEEIYYFSDSSCSSTSYVLKNSYKDLTILSQKTNGYSFSYKYESSRLKPMTSEAKTYWENLFSGGN